ncbi:hypothetical protein GCM10010166_51120 [Couchioplanes caeruleus subsp. azureus]|nr:hypothetical protein GCM10010166_51120 [Couchioplanes caeruleus subsp. azureus]
MSSGPHRLRGPGAFEEAPMTEVLAAITVQVVSSLLIALIVAVAKRVFTAVF